MAGTLTALDVRRLVAKGVPKAHADGGNLYLKITGPGAGKWSFRFMLEGRAREAGLGPCELVSLAEARADALDARKLLRQGIDPIEYKRAARAAQRLATGHPFKDVAAQFIKDHQAEWSNAKHAGQWEATLRTYAFPVIEDMAVATVNTEAVKRILDPIWTAKPETARRVRGRIESILDYAKVRGWRDGENPARWKGHLDAILAKRGRDQRVQHHAALPWRDMPAFMAELGTKSGTAALALRFAILTAARSGEVRGATWAEIDTEQRMWTVPASRMKAGREHRVPLSNAALAVTETMRPMQLAGAELVFPSPSKARAPLSDMTLAAVLKRMGRGDITAHGFRSAFRDWASEYTNHPHEAVEMALAHAVGNRVEAAYRRGDLFEKRRNLMEDWAAFCCDGAT